MLSGKCILIVEDSALIAVDIESVLGELGAARFVTAGGGETRLPPHLTDDHFDLAILDIRTASVIGDALLSMLTGGSVPVVFLTTDPQGNGVPAFEGRCETVQKPFTYEDLCGAIARLVA